MRRALSCQYYMGILEVSPRIFLSHRFFVDFRYTIYNMLPQGSRRLSESMDTAVDHVSLYTTIK